MASKIKVYSIVAMLVVIVVVSTFAILYWTKPILVSPHVVPPNQIAVTFVIKGNGYVQWSDLSVPTQLPINIYSNSTILFLKNDEISILAIPNSGSQFSYFNYGGTGVIPMIAWVTNPWQANVTNPFTIVVHFR